MTETVSASVSMLCMDSPICISFLIFLIIFYRKAPRTHGERWWSLAIWIPTPSLVWSQGSHTKVSWSACCGLDAERSRASTLPPITDHVSCENWKVPKLAVLPCQVHLWTYDAVFLNMCKGVIFSIYNGVIPTNWPWFAHTKQQK